MISTRAGWFGLGVKAEKCGENHPLSSSAAPASGGGDSSNGSDHENRKRSGSDSSGGSVSSLTDNYGTVYYRKKIKSNSLHDMSDALRHKVILALQEAGILDKDERLTEEAIHASDIAIKEGKKLINASVKAALTSNGSQIKDWEKRKTTSVMMSTGQRIQIHFYKNKFTGEVNYTHRDFKIKNRVNPTMTDGKKYKETQLDELLKPRK